MSRGCVNDERRTDLGDPLCYMCEDYKLRLRERELLRLRVGATRKPAPVEHSTGGTSWVKIVK